MAKRIKRLLTDGMVEAMADFSGDAIKAAVVWDTRVAGLQIRCGKTRRTWSFLVERRFRGKRSTIFKRLGFWPGMKVAEARQEALQHAARASAGVPAVGRRDAATVASAMEEYQAHLIEQSARRGKAPRWAESVRSLTRKHLLPAFGTWTLVELSAAPAAVRDFHIRVTRDHGPVIANHSCKVLQAAYRYASRLDRSLPAASPISAVRLNVERPSTAGLSFDQFPAWKSFVAVLPPLHRAYHRFCLFTGMRPGEASRLKWSDLRPRSRSIAVVNAKAGDYSFPMSVEIVQALRLARRAVSTDTARRSVSPDTARRSVSPDTDLVFPGSAQWARDPLPARGRALRRTYRTVAGDLGINEIFVRLLMGHSLQGISGVYVNKLVLTGGPGLRAAQAQISQRIAALLVGAS